MNSILKTLSVTVTLCMLVGVAACSSRTPTSATIWEDSALLGGTIVLMPLDDARADRGENVGVLGEVQDATLRHLRGKGYTVVVPSQDGVYAPVSEGSPRLFVALESLTHDYNFLGDKFTIHLTGQLLDGHTNDVLWRDEGRGETTLGGFFGLIDPRSSRYDAVQQCLRDLFQAIPKQK